MKFKLNDTFELSALASLDMVDSKLWVVLIGVNFYRCTSKTLKGAVNDVEKMELYLKGLGREPMELSTFTATSSQGSNSQIPIDDRSVWPTYENITSKLNQITQDSSPGDFVYIQFSGHGAKQPTTQEYSEQNGTDVALTLFDEAQGSRYLRGLDLARLLEDMMNKNLILTIALDCCFSGSITRDNHSPTVRGLAWDDEIDAAYPPKELIDCPSTAHDLRVQRDAYWKFEWLQNPRGFTLLTACSPHEIAKELECKDDNKYYGALTFFLLDTLRRTYSPATQLKIQSLYDRVCASFCALWDEQTPMLLGNRDVAFLGSTCLPTAEYIAVYRKDGSLRMRIGHEQRVCVNDEYEVYPRAVPDSERRSLTDGPVKAKVTAVRNLECDLTELETIQVTSDIRTGWMARPVKHFPGQPVFVKLVDLSSSATEWENSVEGNPCVYLTNDSFSVDKLRHYHVRLNEKMEYEILDDSCEKFDNVPAISNSSSNSVNRVIGAIEHIEKYKLTKTLQNPSPSPMLENSFKVRFEGPDGDELDSERTMKISENCKLGVIFQNVSQLRLYLSLYYLNPEWQVVGLTRKGGGPDYIIIEPQNSDSGNKGTWRSRIKMTIPQDLKLAGQNSCEDVLKVFVTMKPTSFSMLTQGRLGTSDVSTRGGSSHLSDFSASLAVPHRSPSLDGGTDDTGWTTKKFTIRTHVVTEGEGEGESQKV